jgi:hypothetical protein
MRAARFGGGALCALAAAAAGCRGLDDVLTRSDPHRATPVVDAGGRDFDPPTAPPPPAARVRLAYRSPAPAEAPPDERARPAIQHRFRLVRSGSVEEKKDDEDWKRRFEDLERRYKADVDALKKRLDQLEKNGAAPKDRDAELEEVLKAARKEADDERPDKKYVLQPLQDALSALAGRANALNPRITVIGDFIGRLDPGPGGQLEGANRFSLREVELDIRADIDPHARAVFILALEEEAPGEFAAAVEEGYLVLHHLPFVSEARQKLLPEFQLGRFRSGFGFVNKIHAHDLPWVDAPAVIRRVFGEEGLVGDGGAIAWNALDVCAGALSLRGEIINGDNDTLLAGPDSNRPAGVGRLAWFNNWTESAFTEAGVSYLFGEASRGAGAPTHCIGADVLFKWKSAEKGQYRSFIAGAEGILFYRNGEIVIDDAVDPPATARVRTRGYGGYVFGQCQLDRDLYVGVRGDYVKGSPQGGRISEWSVEPYASYYLSEFLRLRVGYKFTNASDEPVSHTVFFQATFVIGAHPPEPYWVNK